MDSKPEISLLYDFYGELLQSSQQRVVELYVNDDLSLSEAAEILAISRQGVRDSINRAAKKLREYEEKLGLLRAYREREKIAGAIRGEIGAIRALSDNDEIHGLCDSILGYTDHLTEKEDDYGL